VSAAPAGGGFFCFPSLFLSPGFLLLRGDFLALRPSDLVHNLFSPRALLLSFCFVNWLVRACCDNLCILLSVYFPWWLLMHWWIFAKEGNLAVLPFLALSEHYSVWLFKKETLLEKKYPLKNICGQGIRSWALFVFLRKISYWSNGILWQSEYPKADACSARFVNAHSRHL